MKKIQLLFLAIPLTMSVISCSRQEPKTMLDSKVFMQNDSITSTYQTGFEVKIKDKVVPLLAKWNTYYDAQDNCNKVANYSIERTGGDEGIVFSNVEGRYSGTCFLRMDEDDPQA